MFWRRHFILGGVAAVILLVAAIGFKHHHKSQVKSNTSPAVVEIAPVKTINWRSSASVVGTVMSENGVQLTAQTQGAVKAISFNSGDLVQKNQLLVTIDPESAKAALDNAKADYESALDLYDRYKKLVKIGGALSASDLAKTKFGVEAAKAKMLQAQADYDHCFIRAPFAGKVGIRQVNLGQYVTSGQPIVNLESVPPVYVDFLVPQSVATQLQTGDVVSVKPYHAAQQKLVAKIIAMDSVIDPNTRTVEVRARFNNPSSTLYPGSFVTVTYYQTPAGNVVVVPQVAIDYEPYGQTVYVVEQSIAKLRYIKVGARQGDYAVVISGLKPGEQIVVAGQNKLFDGATVTAAQ